MKIKSKDNKERQREAEGARAGRKQAGSGCFLFLFYFGFYLYAEDWRIHNPIQNLNIPFLFPICIQFSISILGKISTEDLFFDRLIGLILALHRKRLFCFCGFWALIFNMYILHFAVIFSIRCICRKRSVWTDMLIGGIARFCSSTYSVLMCVLGCAQTKTLFYLISLLEFSSFFYSFFLCVCLGEIAQITAPAAFKFVEKHCFENNM